MFSLVSSKFLAMCSFRLYSVHRTERFSFGTKLFLWQVTLNSGGFFINSVAASEWAGWALAHLEFGSSVNPITTRGQIMPTTLLLAHPDLKTQRHLCCSYTQFLILIVIKTFHTKNLFLCKFVSS